MRDINDSFEPFSLFLTQITEIWRKRIQMAVKIVKQVAGGESATVKRAERTIPNFLTSQTLPSRPVCFLSMLSFNSTVS